MTITVSLAAAQANLTQLVDQVAATHQRVEVTRDGVPASRGLHLYLDVFQHG
ncbi:MAG: hypothetical protein CSA83_01140 [Actinomycetales bacterium]|nr:MAG: hypothetical protein CSA83_01140 [Actinomycetales bacterium]